VSDRAGDERQLELPPDDNYNSRWERTVVVV